jgi:hypothetical protein
LIVRWNMRRYWPIVGIAITASIVAGVYWKLNQVSREPPNYSQVEDGLWIGGLVPEPPPGTQVVLNLCESDDSYKAEVHRWAPIPDSEPAPSLDWLRDQVGFVESARSAGRVVYIHCRAGISRSGMVLTAYLMRREKWSRDQALEYIRQKRPVVRPNPAFMQLLLEWEQSIKG